MALSVQEIQEAQWKWKGCLRGFERFAKAAKTVVENQYHGAAERRGDDLNFKLFGASFRLRFRFLPSQLVGKVTLQQFCNDDGADRWVDVDSYLDDFLVKESDLADPSSSAEYQASVERVLSRMIATYIASDAQESEG